MAYKYLGKGRKLVTGKEKVMGAARYVADIKLPGMLYGQVVLSPHAHANILSVDKASAETIPGVVAVLTWDDLPTRDRVITSRNSAVLAKERVIWAGQPVAVVVGETAAAAADGAEALFIDYEALPAAGLLLHALKPDAPVVWPHGLPREDGGDLGSAHASAEGGASESASGYNNVSQHKLYARGDIDAGFAAADVVVERRYTTHHVHQNYLETHAVIAEPTPMGDGVTLYTSTQGQFLVRDEVARQLSLPTHRVKVVTMTVGGAFGAKYGIYDPLAAACAMALQRAIRIVISRSDDLRSTTPSPAFVIDLKTGATADGTLTALKASIFSDNGVFGFYHTGIVTMLMAGFYRWPNVHIDTYEVHTHKTPVGAYRAPGSPQCSFAVEGNMEAMLRELGLDGLEFRLQNAAEAGDFTGLGTKWPSLGVRQVLERLREQPLWQNRHTLGENEGLGIGVGGWGTMVQPSEALCRVESDGSVQILVGNTDISGNASSFVLIAAEVFDLSPDKIHIIQTDTSGGYAPWSGGSQVTYSMAGAVDGAAKAARTKLLKLAADRMEADVADMELVEGFARVKGVPDKQISMGKLATMARFRAGAGGPIVGEGTAAITENAPAVSAHLVKVHVDKLTGEIRPLDYVCVQDVGFALNPTVVEGQIHGGMLQGLGMALQERLVFDADGQLLSGSFMDYALPLSDNAPRLQAVFVSNPSPLGPFGARGIGEPPITGGPAAVANAVYDAVGVVSAELPIRAELVAAALLPTPNSKPPKA